MQNEVDEWFMQLQQETTNPQSKEETDKWWNSLTETEKQEYINDIQNHI